MEMEVKKIIDDILDVYISAESFDLLVLKIILEDYANARYG